MSSAAAECTPTTAALEWAMWYAPAGTDAEAAAERLWWAYVARDRGDA